MSEMKFIRWFLAIAVLLAVGCKKVKEDPPRTNYGPQTSADKIVDEIERARKGATFENMQPGQYLDFVTNRRLENEENTTTLGGLRIEVIDRKETDQLIQITLRITQSERMNDGGFETTVSEQTLDLEKSALAAAVAQAGRAEADALVASSGQVQAQREPVDVTFHNLKVTGGVVQAPQAVRQREGCGGLSPCEIPVTFIEFDVVSWYENGESTRVSIDWAFSPKTPWLPYGNPSEFTFLSGLMITDCASTYISLDDRTVYVRQCKNLEDFQK